MDLDIANYCQDIADYCQDIVMKKDIIERIIKGIVIIRIFIIDFVEDTPKLKIKNLKNK